MSGNRYEGIADTFVRWLRGVPSCVMHRREMKTSAPPSDDHIAKNAVPTLIVHGDADRILPADATSRRQAKMIKHVKFAEIAGGPHGLCWTHADRVNAELVPFVA